jgi:hypothetical protein
MSWILRLIAFGFLASFLGILAFWVQRIDLGAVLLVTLLMAGYDIFFYREKKN